MVSKFCLGTVACILVLAGCGGDAKAVDHFIKGKIAYESNDLEQAIGLFEKAYEADDSLMNAGIMKAKAEYYLKKYDDAQKTIDQVLEDHDESSVALYWSAKIQLIKEDTLKAETIKRAQQLLKKSLEINSDFHPARELLAQTYLYQNDYKTALLELNRALQADKDLIYTRLYLARTYEKIGMNDYAEEEFRRLVAIADALKFTGEDISAIRSRFNETKK